jgi:hypothetical protein
MMEASRRQVLVTIQDEGRDKGKTYLIEELSAMAAEEWAMRAVLAVLRSGGELQNEDLDALKQLDWTDEAIAKKGMALVAVLGIKLFAGLEYDRAKPLLDQMLKAVYFVPDPAKLEIRHKLLPDEIQELKTVLRLRAEFLSLHTGFSLSGALSMMKDPSETRTPRTSLIIPTSQNP